MSSPARRFTDESWDLALSAYAEALHPHLAPLVPGDLDEHLRAKAEGDVEEIVDQAFQAQTLSLSSDQRQALVAEHLFQVLAPSDASSPVFEEYDQEGREWIMRRVSVVLAVLDQDAAERSGS